MKSAGLGLIACH